MVGKDMTVCAGMPTANRWLLPEGVDELLPEDAARMEGLRRRLVNLCHTWGYELVVPPLIEYLESLLTGMGSDLDLQTFKLTDQGTGRLMGVRADITPQAARIDAHRLKRDAPTRLCYVGPTLRTRSDGFGGSRSPLQLGAELFGHAGSESDLEILGLMLETLDRAQVPGVQLDVGHVGIYRGLVDGLGLDVMTEAALFDALQRKAEPELAALIADLGLPKAAGARLLALPELAGGADILETARRRLEDAPPLVGAALDQLETIAGQLAERYPDTPVHFDLAELRGYRYHTGVVFAAYCPGHGRAVAQGGRYDEIGAVFGRSRPATGFSADLRQLVALTREPAPAAMGVFAPPENDPGLREAIRRLRAQGERVVQALPGQRGGAETAGCDRELRYVDGAWVAEEREEATRHG